MNSNIIPSIALVISILIAAIPGWMNLSQSSAINDATLGGRVAALEVNSRINRDIPLRVAVLESSVRSLGKLVVAYEDTEDDVTEVSQMIAVLKIRIADLGESEGVNSAEIRDLQISLAKIVTLLKMRKDP